MEMSQEIRVRDLARCHANVDYRHRVHDGRVIREGDVREHANRARPGEHFIEERSHGGSVRRVRQADAHTHDPAHPALSVLEHRPEVLEDLILEPAGVDLAPGGGRLLRRDEDQRIGGDRGLRVRLLGFGRCGDANMFDGHGRPSWLAVVEYRSVLVRLFAPSRGARCHEA